jgi:hypothetical protein
VLKACGGLLLVLLGGAVPAIADPAPPVTSLRVGAAAIELRLPSGVPLAGYGALARRLLIPDLLARHPHAFWLRPSTGTRDPIMARALVIEAGAERLLWVAADLVAVDGAFAGDLEALAARLGFRYSAVIVSASHTHSGPGAFIPSELFGMFATDRLDAEVRASLLAAVTSAVREAEGRKARARFGAGTTTAPPVTVSRLDRPLDPEIAILKFVRGDGRPLALLWNFAIHGTVLGPGNLRLSGDVMGVASRRLEAQLGVPALFVNGAVGDVSPAGHGEEAVRETGEQLAHAVRAAWRSIPVRGGAALTLARARLDLPRPSLSVKNCLSGWAPGGFAIPLESALPTSGELLAGRLGPSAWVTIPGELQTELGRVVKAAGRRRSPVSVVAGLSNGYLGYFLTPDAYHQPGYVACASLYGARAGRKVAAAAAELLEQVGARRSIRASRDGGRALTSSGQRCCGG